MKQAFILLLLIVSSTTFAQKKDSLRAIHDTVLIMPKTDTIKNVKILFSIGDNIVRYCEKGYVVISGMTRQVGQGFEWIPQSQKIVAVFDDKKRKVNLVQVLQ